jgi:NCAIR mutase (PurE)-related protein
MLTMLTSCAANVAVVNIDAGFKAGYLAGMIARQSTAVGRDLSRSPNSPNPSEPA